MRKTRERGLALLIVLITLGVLAVIATPFAISMMLQERTSRNYQKDVQARMAAEGAKNHAIASLLRSHDSNERRGGAEAPFDTPDCDGLDELQVDWEAPSDLAGRTEVGNPRGAIWGVTVQDEQGKINLRSAPDLVLDNLRSIVDPTTIDMRNLLTEHSYRASQWVNPQTCRGFGTRSISAGEAKMLGLPGPTKAEALFVDNTSSYGPGVRVRITHGADVFYALCTKAPYGAVILDTKPPEALTRPPAVIEAEARHPVNINTAPREVIAACLIGLKILGRTDSAIDADKAKKVADRIVTQTFTDWDDLRKFLGTLREEQLITRTDSRAIFSNAKNPLDLFLVGSGTMPFCYRSYDVYAIEGSGTYSDSSANQRAHHAFREVVALTPPRPVEWKVESQVDFEREMSGPTGNLIQSYPAWIAGGGKASDARGRGVGDIRSVIARDTRGGGIVFEEHFDRTQEGSPIGGGYSIVPDKLLGQPDWTQQKPTPDIQAGGIEFWTRFDSIGSGESVLFDTGVKPAENRITLFYDGRDLVLRAYDATLDRWSAVVRAADMDFKTGVWYHIGAYWKGTRYAHLALMVDGRAVGRFAHADDRGDETIGRLAGSLSGVSDVIGVKGADTFPDVERDESGDVIPVAIEVGGEVMSYVGKSSGSLTLKGSVGQNTVIYRGDSGKGGNLQRFRGTIPVAHPAGAAVSLFGYSNLLKVEQMSEQELGGMFAIAIMQMLNPQGLPGMPGDGRVPGMPKVPPGPGGGIKGGGGSDGDNGDSQSRADGGAVLGVLLPDAAVFADDGKGPGLRPGGGGNGNGGGNGGGNGNGGGGNGLAPGGGAGAGGAAGGGKGGGSTTPARPFNALVVDRIPVVYGQTQENVPTRTALCILGAIPYVFPLPKGGQIMGLGIDPNENKMGGAASDADPIGEGDGAGGAGGGKGRGNGNPGNGGNGVGQGDPRRGPKEKPGVKPQDAGGGGGNSGGSGKPDGIVLPLSDVLAMPDDAGISPAPPGGKGNGNGGGVGAGNGAGNGGNKGGVPLNIPQEMAKYPPRGFLLIGTPMHDRVVRQISQNTACGMEIIYYSGHNDKEFTGIERSHFGTNPDRLPLVTTLWYINDKFELVYILRTLPAMIYSIQISSIAGYGSPCLVQIDDEWILGDPFSWKGEDYLLGLQPPSPIPDVLVALPLEGFRFRDGMGDGLAGVTIDLLRGFPLHGLIPNGPPPDPLAGPKDHKAGMKVIPVFAVQDPWCGRGDWVTIVEKGQAQKDRQRVRRSESLYKTQDPSNIRASNFAAFWDLVKREHRPDGKLNRLLKFPSGELLSELPSSARVGAPDSSLAASTEHPTRGTVDEIRGFSGPKGNFLVDAILQNKDTGVKMNGVRGIPATGGAIKVGDEFIGYCQAGGVMLSNCARGYLGSPAEAHDRGERAFSLSFLPVTALGGNLTKEGQRIPLGAQSSQALALGGLGAVAQSAQGTPGFGPYGYIRVDDEIIGYTWNRGSRLEMPVNEKGQGIFRGAFGTRAEPHSPSGPIFAIPYRYFDRYRPESFDSQMQYFEAGTCITNATWRRVTWEGQVPDGIRLHVLARVDGKPEWTTPPTNKSGGLYEFTQPAGKNAMDLRGDQLEIRLYIEYREGAYTTDAWKATPVIDTLSAEYTRPITTLVHEEE